MIALPPVDPDLHTILAKSGDPGESLVEHTWHVLSRLADQRRLRPTLGADVSSPRLWHWLYWGTFLHDFGKAAGGFQAVLKRQARSWGFRHEALSLAFVDWLFPEGDPDRPYVIAVIACHHRDAAVIVQTYTRNRDDPDEDSATKLIQQLHDADSRRLYRWLAECGRTWAEALGFAADLDFPTLLPVELALQRLTPRAIHRAISELARYVTPLVFAADAPAALTGALLRGLILTADHAGSAHSEPFQPAPLERSAVTAALGTVPLFPHQTAADTAPPGSVLLISPTSSGKTEAALLWLARQQVYDGRPAARLFYLLPYQTSMNAAYGRLARVFRAPSAVGLHHSRMAQVLYAAALANQADNDTAAAYARQQQALAGLLSFSVTVMSPYQLLKIPYQLKGFEALLAHFYGGRFIVDEIHAYEPKRLAAIIAMIRFLHRTCRARFCIMTATLPPQVLAALRDALPDLQTITADAPTFQRFRRHRVQVLPGDLLAPGTVQRILDDAAGKSVLIGCNTVRRALEVHAALDAALRARSPDGAYKLILLHSRYNSRDRQDKERQIMDGAGVGSGRRERVIVVATQVIEVSLNLDLDTLYTEAAPLEALLQRFGRVNRGRPAGAALADVFVLREQPEAVQYIYDRDLIDAALRCLEAADGLPVDESRVSAWLADVYAGEALERWNAAYAESWDSFHTEVLNSLRPFNTTDLDQLFFRLFDGVDVLPAAHLDEYDALIRAGRYLEAAGWLVPVSWRDYKRLERLGRAWHETADGRRGDVYVVSVPYTPERGLDLYAENTTAGLPATPLDSFDVPTEAD